jgi:coniferyl-aldehyde dehydrogenase
MPIIDSDHQTLETPSLSDETPIAQLRAAFAAQRAAFNRDRMPSLEERKARLRKLIEMMLNYRERISAALSDDFGCHPVAASDLIEVLGPLARAQYVIEQLEEWMRPDPRKTDPAMMGTAQVFMESQPKGVIGNIVPWNFPFDLSVGPMTEMLAAGNRIIVKPSDYTPACATLLREMVSKTFDATLVYVAVGGIGLAREFSDLPWDHLLYTGSTNVGREVMQAAARNLTPVTLELGGKCPAVLTPGSVNATNIESIIGTKTVKNGQMCISVDYCLVARGEVESFVQLARDFMQHAAGNYSQSADCTGIVSRRHFDRLSDMLQEARDRGSRIVELEPHSHANRERRRMPMSLVINPSAELRVMREEIFGPILPLVAYDDLDQAIGMINSGGRPLGAYVFGEDRRCVDGILSQIISGGAAINCCAIQGALPSLGFGGTGASGMGRHHGIEGFREFSNQRGVVVRGTGDQFDAFYAPYTKAAAIVKAMDLSREG